MGQMRGFIGTVVAGEFSALPDGTLGIDVAGAVVLGTGFLVSPAQGIFLTCEHVLPRGDFDHKVMKFAMLLPGDGGRNSVHPIDPTFYEQWDANDLVALRVKPEPWFQTYPWRGDTPLLGDQWLAVGLPASFTAKRTVVRGLTTFIVTVYDQFVEVDRPFIKTMSGCPLMRGSWIVGVAYQNEKYVSDYETYEDHTEETRDGSITTRIVSATYKQTSYFGRAHRPSAFLPWLKRVLDENSGIVAESDDGLPRRAIRS